MIKKITLKYIKRNNNLKKKRKCENYFFPRERNSYEKILTNKAFYKDSLNHITNNFCQ